MNQSRLIGVVLPLALLLFLHPLPLMPFVGFLALTLMAFRICDSLTLVACSLLFIGF